MIGFIAIALVAITSALLFVFGVNLLYLTVRALRRPCLAFGPAPDEWNRGEPLVCVQVPVYNERYVAERVIDAVCAIEWPRDRYEVQVLDDSDDDTTGIVARSVARWRREGVAVAHVRRGSRTGFKAGALAYGLARTKAPYLAIFDADFVPPRDFLRRIMSAFDEPTVAFAQARWGHLDEGYSLFTRLQAMAIDFHFLVEQPVRSSSGYFTNFTGTAGVWRRTAIEDAGGWSARTLTEDLDLSYRAQLRGWKAAYLEDLVVPEELPVSIDAYRRQQSRWATGSFQTAFRLLGPLMRSELAASTKFQATVHLLAYSVGPLMLVQLACYPALLFALGPAGIRLPPVLAASATVAIVVGTTPWVGFIAAQTRRGRKWWSGLPALFCQAVGAGMSLNTILALVRALRPGGAFERTPKHHIVRRGEEWRDKVYVRVGDPRALIEGAAGLAALALVPVAAADGEVLVGVYASMFGLGFLLVAGLSAVDLLEVLTLRRLGKRALSRVQAGLPAMALLGAAALLLLFAARMPEPFEDGYGHWLIAANLATTGNLHDPLFGMEDTWLPGYQVLAASVLHVFGLWQLAALKTMSAILAVATAACVYALAPNARQARIATALLVLNPVFLFTSGSAVVEPLVTALLTGAGLAAVKRQMKVASILAALAVITSTKAWIWVAAAVAYAGFELVRSRGLLRSRGAIGWAVPALALLVLLQLGFAPATHSVTRGTIEVVSASARGSIPSSGLARLLELGQTFGLAALPLFAMAPFGLVAARRDQAMAASWKFVYVPALVYLAAVFGLVAAGYYTGSHRYLYPALPALALLAAAALDRHGRTVRLVVVGATALLAVGFLPVFWSFGDLNSGLVAAGRASAGSPGMLVTDSPVVAYYSGRPPSRISGSSVLPANRADALAWMREHDVTTVVVENVSYYRATALFPDLATGNATRPFLSIGDQGWYQVSGGKPVYAYRLWPELSMRSTAQGKTAPLAKGITMGAGTGEGMGFGVPIVQYPDGWVYSRTSTTVQLSPTSWTRIFELDEIGGDAAHRYAFVPIDSRGEIAVTYVLDASGVAITVRTVWLAPGYSKVAILNEQSAAFDDLATAGQPTRVGAAFGNWVPVTGTWARLRSASLGVEWSVSQIADASLYAGRESVGSDFDWAGLDYMFSGTFTGTTYRINVQEAR